MLISEIFYSVQGEGELTGVPSVFIRTSGCNLRCRWCDTPYASWNPEGTAMSIDQILAEGFVDTFRHFEPAGGHYTWWSHFAKARERNIGWRIDYIFVSNTLKSKVLDAQILPEVLGSDHCPVMVELK